MIVTEEEAKTKWCPRAQVVDAEGNAAANREFSSGGPDADCMCLGSGCMAWRWARGLEPSLVSSTARDGFHHITAEEAQEGGDGDKEFWVEPLETAQKRRLGYCALAGKPENLNA